MIDPNFWASEDVSCCSAFARLVFLGLVSNADDEGRGRAKPMYLRSILFPYDENIRLTDIENALSEIARHLSVCFYTVEGSRYYALTNWHDWQSIDRPKPSKIPAPDEASAEDRRSIDDASRPKEEEEKENLKKKEKEKPPAAPLGEYGNVLLSETELARLQAEFPDWQARIERLSAYLASSGKRYQSHYATIRSWARRDSADAVTAAPARPRQSGGAPHSVGVDAIALAAIRQRLAQRQQAPDEPLSF